MKTAFLSLSNWAFDHGKSIADRFADDLKSLRVVWVWIYLALYVWVVVWGVLFYAPLCLNTVITVTGGIVMAAMTNYVWSRLSERKSMMSAPVEPTEPVGPDVDSTSGPK